MTRTLASWLVGGIAQLFASTALAQSAPSPTPPMTPDAPAATSAPSTPPSTVVVAQPAAPQPAVARPESRESIDERQNGGQSLEWAYLNADTGVAYAALASLNASNWALQDTRAAGPAFGFGAGVRLLFLQLGLRVRDEEFSSFNMWEVNAEAAFHMKVWVIDPYFGARGGYAFLGALSTQALETSTGTTWSNVTVHGWNVGPMLGLDVYFSKLISLGAEANAEFLFLERPPIPLQPGQTVASQYRALYADSGSSVGVGAVGMAHLGLHF